MAQSEAPLERRLWLACAPPLTRVPNIGALAYYFPRGHASQCDGTAPTGQATDDKYLCMVRSVDLLVRGDDVYARIGLAPVDGAGFLADHRRMDARDIRGNARSEEKSGDVVSGDEFYARIGLAPVDGADHAHHGHMDSGHARCGKDDDVVRDPRDSVDVRDLKDAVGLRAHAHHHRKDSQDVRGHARCEKNCGDVVSGYTRRGKDDAVARDHARQDKGDVCEVGVCDDAKARDLKDGSVVLDHARCDLKRTVVVPDSGSVRADHALLDAKARDLKDDSVVLDHARGELKDHAPLDVKARVQLILQPEDAAIDDDTGVVSSSQVLVIFPKLLTANQVMVSRTGALHLPNPCATGIFPPLQAQRPKQKLRMVDLGGIAFEFTHTLSGQRRHLLITGWNNFVKIKHPKEDDVLLFIRSGEGIRISLQRAAVPAAFVRPEEVADAARLAAEGTAFTVVWCPRRGAEYVLPRKEVEEALSIKWAPGMRVSCRTGVVRHNVLHLELPHEVVSRQGTVKAVHNRDWQKLDVDWDTERSGSAGTSTATSMTSQFCFRLFGFDIRP